MNIQKILFTALFAVSSFTFISAQTVQKGDLTFQAGVGLLPTYFQDASETKVLPLQAAVTYKFLNMLSVGAFAGYSDYDGSPVEMYDGSVYQTNTKTILGGARFAAHATGMDGWDIYGGLQVGYSKPSVSTTVLVAYESQIPGPTAKVREEVIYSGFIGATGYVTDHLGFYGEVGYGISLFNVGVTLKI